MLAPAAGDEEAARAPLLGDKAGAAAGDKDSSGHGAASKAQAEDPAKKKVNPKTVMELVRMSRVDTPVLVVAFTAGCVAAVFQVGPRRTLCAAAGVHGAWAPAGASEAPVMPEGLVA